MSWCHWEPMGTLLCTSAALFCWGHGTQLVAHAAPLQGRLRTRKHSDEQPNEWRASTSHSPKTHTKSIQINPQLCDLVSFVLKDALFLLKFTNFCVESHVSNHMRTQASFAVSRLRSGQTLRMTQWILTAHSRSSGASSSPALTHKIIQKNLHQDTFFPVDPGAEQPRKSDNVQRRPSCRQQLPMKTY